MRQGWMSRVLNRGKDVAFVPLLDGCWRRRLRGRVTCLLYHRVDGSGSGAFLTRGGVPLVRPTELDADLRFLRRQGATFLRFADLRAGRFPDADELAVIICFDDCFRDNYRDGLEVLESLGVKGVFFQTTRLVGGRSLIWEHALYWHTRDEERSESFTKFVHRRASVVAGTQECAGHDLVRLLREEAPAHAVEELLADAAVELGGSDEMAEAAGRLYPEPAEIREAAALGQEVGCHGHNHYKRKNVPTDVFEQELATSARTIREITGVAPEAFSYPFNGYEPGDDRICARYFRQAATVEPGRISRESDPMWLPRFTWPGPAPNRCRQRRWLFTGRI